jgi:formate--tetrahydrofolate ligase
VDLAKAVIKAAESESARATHRPVYELSQPVRAKVTAIAREIYGAREVVFTPAAEAKISRAENDGFGGLSICMAKTQNSLSDNPKLLGRPRDFAITVRDIEIASGAGFIVVLTGEMTRMPGLPQIPSAEKIDVDEDGRILNLT